MSAEADRQRQVFFELHRDLPRQAPGSRASTARALSLVVEHLPRREIRQVLDVGCGPGAQTLDLAALLPAARIVALDLHRPFVLETRRRTLAAGVADRVTALCADMGRLPIAPSSVDLVWCEGAAYLIGVAESLARWRPLLRGAGAIAFTDAVWLRADPPQAAREFWAGYPAMTDRAGVLGLVEAAGFAPETPFVLPSEAWWTAYYRPLAERLDRLAPRYRGDPVAMTVLDACRREIDLYRDHGDCYGYAFFVAHLRSGRGR